MDKSPVSRTNYLRLVLTLYNDKEITLRMLASALDISLWEALELPIQATYELQDLQRDLNLLS